MTKSECQSTKELKMIKVPELRATEAQRFGIRSSFVIRTLSFRIGL